MELDTKQKVLLAIYMEYQKDIPNMSEAIRAETLGIEKQALHIALGKLENEGLIKDLNILYADDTIHDVFVENIKMTRDGIEYVESKFSIEPTFSSAEKLRELTKKTVSWGWEQAKDIIARTLSEIIKKQ